jgi:hypothetical protein
MRKDDTATARMMISKIKNRSMDYHLWEYTKFWDDWNERQKDKLYSQYTFEPGEIPVLAIILDDTTSSVFSSRAIYYSNKDMKARVAAAEIGETSFDNFKGYRQKFETINIQSKNIVHKIYFETGKASLAPIYALFTLQNLR